MEYYIELARQQLERFREFERNHPDDTRLENRLAFFGQTYEIHISHSITQGISTTAPPRFH